MRGGPILAPFALSWLVLFEVVVLVITLACFAVPLGAGIRSLRSDEVRDAIAHGPGRPR